MVELGEVALLDALPPVPDVPLALVPLVPAAPPVPAVVPYVPDEPALAPELEPELELLHAASPIIATPAISAVRVDFFVKGSSSIALCCRARAHDSSEPTDTARECSTPEPRVCSCLASKEPRLDTYPPHSVCLVFPCGWDWPRGVNRCDRIRSGGGSAACHH